MHLIIVTVNDKALTLSLHVHRPTPTTVPRQGPSSMSRLLVSALVPVVLATSAVASERQFTYVYDSNVAAPGSKEVELSTTQQRGHADEAYNKAVNRLELEVGLTARLQTALYLNFTRETVDGASEEEHSASWEWKYKFADAAADAIGFAGYGEISMSSDELELELKAIADKRIGNELFAANLTYEPAWSIAQDATKLLEHEIELTIGWSHRCGAQWTAGIELRNHSAIVKESSPGGSEWVMESSAVFLGPALHISLNEFWFTATAMPQIIALNGETAGTGLDLEHHERFEFRVIAGIQF